MPPDFFPHWNWQTQRVCDQVWGQLEEDEFEDELEKDIERDEEELEEELEEDEFGENELEEKWIDKGNRRGVLSGWPNVWWESIL